MASFVTALTTFLGGSAAAAGGAAAAGSAATSAVATAGSAAAAVGAGAKTLSFATSVLQGITTAASVRQLLRGGASDKAEGEISARLEELAGKQEFEASRVRSLALRRELRDTVGRQRVAFAAGGVEVNSGTPLAVQQDTQREGEFQIALEQQSGRIRQLNRLLKADRKRRAGALSSSTSKTDALVKAGKFGIDLLERI